MSWEKALSNKKMYPSDNAMRWGYLREMLVVSLHKAEVDFSPIRVGPMSSYSNMEFLLAPSSPHFPQKSSPLLPMKVFTHLCIETFWLAKVHPKMFTQNVHIKSKESLDN